jgi:hypothetical protein
LPSNQGQSRNIPSPQRGSELGTITEIGARGVPELRVKQRGSDDVIQIDLSREIVPRR